MAELSLFVDTPDIDTEERFVREYIVPAIDRLNEPYRIAFFGRYAAAADVEGGRVKISFDGDPDEIRAGERDRWNSFDYINGWETDIETEQEATILTRCARVAAQMNVHYFAEFDDRPFIGGVPDDDFHDPGIWTLIHFLLNGQGYTPEEETEIFFLALRDRLARIAVEHDGERVDELVTEFHARLDETQERIDRDVLSE